jgi:hypothetical protein
MAWRPQKNKVVGPLEVIAMHGRHWIIDRGNGSIILPASYRTRRSAERWAYRHRTAILRGQSEGN